MFLLIFFLDNYQILGLFLNSKELQYICSGIYDFQSFDPLQYPNIHILHSHACSYEYICSFMTHGCVCVMHAIKIVILSNVLSFFFSNDLQLIKNLIFSATINNTNKKGFTRKQEKLEK